MAHQYARRTFDEAVELAKAAFRATAEQNLSAADLEELQRFGAKTGGTPKDGWNEVLGHEPMEKDYYEVELYKPSEERPYVSRIYVRMLVPRNRSSTDIHFKWLPPVPSYTGPYFT